MTIKDVVAQHLFEAINKFVQADVSTDAKYNSVGEATTQFLLDTADTMIDTFTTCSGCISYKDLSDVSESFPCLHCRRYVPKTDLWTSK